MDEHKLGASQIDEGQWECGPKIQSCHFIVEQRFPMIFRVLGFFQAYVMKGSLPASMGKVAEQGSHAQDGSGRHCRPIQPESQKGGGH